MAKIFVLGSFAESLVNFRGPMLSEMVKRGHHVVTCAPAASSEIQNALNAMGVEYHDVPIERAGLNPIKDLQIIYRLFALFREIKPDIFLGYTIKPVIYGSIAARLAGVPRIFSMITGLGYAFSDGGLKKWLVGAVVRFLYKLGMGANRRVFFQNPDDRDIFLRLGFLRNFVQAALINGSGVDVDFFQPVPFPEKISFLLIARLIKDKGILEYVKAARIVKKRYPQARFYLVGWIDEGPQGISSVDLDSWVKEGTIEYLGRLEDVRPAIADAARRAHRSLKKLCPNDSLVGSMGCSIGLDVREPPQISMTGRGVFRERMVFSVHPACQFRPSACAKIGDILLVTNNGCESLSHLLRETM